MYLNKVHSEPPLKNMSIRTAKSKTYRKIQLVNNKLIKTLRGRCGVSWRIGYVGELGLVTVSM